MGEGLNKQLWVQVASDSPLPFRERVPARAGEGECRALAKRFDSPQQVFEHKLRPKFDLIIPIPDDMNTATRKFATALLIVRFCFRLTMLATVHLDSEGQLRAVEIKNVRAYGNLSAKFATTESPVAQMEPEDSLCLGHLAAKRPGQGPVEAGEAETVCAADQVAPKRLVLSRLREAGDPRDGRALAPRLDDDRKFNISAVALLALVIALALFTEVYAPATGIRLWKRAEP